MTASRRALIVVGVVIAVALGLPWGGSVRDASAQSIQVISATPPSAEQGTLSLPVTIKGNGFRKGAKAKFYKGGTTDPAGISVSSTRFIDFTQLVATIDVADTAAVAGFDIVVQNADGRTGKGTELFKVTEKVSPCAVTDPIPILNGYTTGAPGFPGAFDSTFGINGTGKTSGPRNFRGWLEAGLAIQTVDGEPRYVVAGQLHDPCVNNGQSTTVWAVARYLSDGSIDMSFGATPTTSATGIVTTPFSGSATATDVVIDAANRIVVVGSAPSTSKKGGPVNVPTAVRYLENGSLDTLFGATETTAGTGIVKVPTGGVASFPKAAALQADGRIVIAAQDSYSGYLRVIRLTTSGTLDARFNGSGQHLFTAFGSYIEGMTIDSAQRIVVAGDGRLGGNHGALWRFTSEGALDTSFRGSGLVLTNVNGRRTTFESVATDGSTLVVTGNTYRPENLNILELALVRYDETGNLTGQVVVECDTGETATASYGLMIAVQPDGRILIGGKRNCGNPAGDIAIWRFLPDGSLDGTFAGTGWIVDRFTADAMGNSIRRFVQQPDGKLVVVGDLSIGTARVPYMFLARVWQ